MELSAFLYTTGLYIAVAIPLVRISAVFALMEFNRQNYIFPQKNFTTLLTLGAHAQRGLQYLVGVCVCVCLSVTTFSATTHNKAAKK